MARALPDTGSDRGGAWSDEAPTRGDAKGFKDVTTKKAVQALRAVQSQTKLRADGILALVLARKSDPPVEADDTDEKE